MILKCIECGQEFEAARLRGYCDACLESYRETRKRVHMLQRPAPGVYVDGRFADPLKCPTTITDPVTDRQICGICGSAELEQGYGLGTGYGMGSYIFCEECYAFLDFREDND